MPMMHLHRGKVVAVAKPPPTIREEQNITNKICIEQTRIDTTTATTTTTTTTTTTIGDTRQLGRDHIGPWKTGQSTSGQLAVVDNRQAARRHVLWTQRANRRNCKNNRTTLLQSVNGKTGQDKPRVRVISLPQCDNNNNQNNSLQRNQLDLRLTTGVQQQDLCSIRRLARNPIYCCTNQQHQLGPMQQSSSNSNWLYCQQQQQQHPTNAGGPGLGLVPRVGGGPNMINSLNSSDCGGVSVRRSILLPRAQLTSSGSQAKPRHINMRPNSRLSSLLLPNNKFASASNRGIGDKLDNADQDSTDKMDLIKSSSREHFWHWDDANKSTECIVSEDKLSICFHPQCSESAAACRGSEPLKRNGNYYYWEITILDKLYGTSVMFGLCSAKQRLHADDYCNLIGLDENGWSLSHKGFLWHNGTYRPYPIEFPTNQSVTIGMLFNTMRGELSYFMNGQNLGVAFSGLNNISDDLYPVVGSTAKCTRMHLIGAYCGFVSLLERSCFTLLKSIRNRKQLIEYICNNQLPKHLKEYLLQAASACDKQNAIEQITDHGPTFGIIDANLGIGGGANHGCYNQCAVRGVAQQQQQQQHRQQQATTNRLNPYQCCSNTHPAQHSSSLRG